MLRQFVLGLTLLFHWHHAPKPSADVLAFAQQAWTTVESYDDGSLNAAFEHSQIFKIDQDIYQLVQRPYADAQSDALENSISQELDALCSYDQTMNERNFI